MILELEGKFSGNCVGTAFTTLEQFSGLEPVMGELK
jgi:hypothetical protein